MGKIETTAGDAGEVMEHLGLPRDTPVEVASKLTDEEKIAALDALLEEAEQGGAWPMEPFKDRMRRLRARHATA